MRRLDLLLELSPKPQRRRRLSHLGRVPNAAVWLVAAAVLIMVYARRQPADADIANSAGSVLAGNQPVTGDTSDPGSAAAATALAERVAALPPATPLPPVPPQPGPDSPATARVPAEHRSTLSAAATRSGSIVTTPAAFGPPAGQRSAAPGAATQVPSLAAVPPALAFVDSEDSSASSTRTESEQGGKDHSEQRIQSRSTSETIVRREGPKSVSINNRAAPATLRSAVLLGNDSGVFAIGNDSCSGKMLDSGAACRITISFNPEKAGDYSARLFLPDDAGTLIVPVKGSFKVIGYTHTR
jgi:hypothetical protein